MKWKSNYPLFASAALLVIASSTVVVTSAQSIPSFSHNVSGLALQLDNTDRQCLNLPTEQVEFGELDKATWKRWTGLTGLKFLKHPEHLSVDTSLNGVPHLRQQLIPTEKGSHTVTNRNSVHAATQYLLTQSVYLEPGFEWGGTKEGGKIGFGLAGGSSPSGASRATDGFTARFMWRGDGDGSAHIAVYAYTADRTQRYPFGDDYPLTGFRVPIGEWFDLAMEVTVNSSEDIADGSVKAWANGALLLERRNIHWQSSGGTPIIEYLSYASFYGGNDRSWSPSRTTFARFANVCWSESPGSDDDTGDDSDDTENDNVDPTVGDTLKLISDQRAQIIQLIPSGNSRVDWRLNKAVALLNDAAKPAEWQTTNLPVADSLAVFNLRDAVKKLHSASSTEGVQSAQRNGINVIAGKLGIGAAHIGDAAIDNVERLWRTKGCANSSNGDCRDAQRDIQRAHDERQILRQATDTDTIAYQAERIWKRVIRAQDALN